MTLSSSPNLTNSGQVQAERRDAVFVFADELAVHPETAGLPHAVKFEKNLPVLRAGGQLEMLAIPGDAQPRRPGRRRCG